MPMLSTWCHSDPLYSGFQNPERGTGFPVKLGMTDFVALELKNICMSINYSKLTRVYNRL